VSTNHLMGVYNRAPLEVERGRGARLWSTDGTEYLDCVAGISTNGLGHAHPELVQAVKDQAEKLWHVSNIFRIPGQEALADALCESSFADVVFFTNSGTEAVECALKTARKYHSANGQPERIDIYGFDGSFHGRTYGAINAAANPSYTEGFGPPMQGFHQLKWGDKDALKAAFENPTTAAVILEPVQGEGGCRETPVEDLRWMRQMADDNGVLLIFDEVMTGFRTSYAGWYGVDNVAGDLTTFGKVVSGGLPAAAFGGRRDIMEHLAPNGPVYQAGTLSGNPVAMASGLASLELATEDIYPVLNRNADTLERLLHDALTAEGVTHHIQRAATMLSVRFGEGEGHNFADMQAADTFRYAPFFHALLDNGVYAPPSAFETWFVSTALTDEDFGRIEDALRPAAQAAAAAQPAEA